MDLLVTTVTLAAIYALVALGLSITWSGLGFLNLAQGVIFAGAAYGAWWTSQNISSAGPVMLAAGMGTGAILGGLVWILVFLPLDGRRNAVTRLMIATLALSLLGTNALLQIFGPRSKDIPPVFGTGKVDLLGTAITADSAGTIVSAAVLIALVLALMGRSRLGLGVRALTQNPEGAALVGIDRRTAALAILVVSGALTGVASVLLAGVFFVSPGAGYLPLIKGLIVALLGGLGSVPGTIVAALLVGAVEALTQTYIGSEFVLVTLFTLIAVVLLVRPRGVAGILESTRA